MKSRAPLRKVVVHDQIKEWVSVMQNKPEWTTVCRHLLRALLATEQLLERR